MKPNWSTIEAMMQAEEIDKALEPKFKALTVAQQVLDDVDCQLFELAAKRKDAALRLEEAVNHAVSPVIGNKCALYALASAWSKFGFSSPTVREAVKSVRSAFFDDAAPEFKNVLFIDLIVGELDETGFGSDYMTGGTYVAFKFLNTRSTAASNIFEIIVFAPGTLNWNWENNSIRGKIRIVAHYNDIGFVDVMLADTFSHAAAAAAVKRFVADPAKAIQEVRNSMKSRTNGRLRSSALENVIKLLTTGRIF